MSLSFSSSQLTSTYFKYLNKVHTTSVSQQTVFFVFSITYSSRYYNTTKKKRALLFFLIALTRLSLKHKLLVTTEAQVFKIFSVFNSLFTNSSPLIIFGISSKQILNIIDTPASQPKPYVSQRLFTNLISSGYFQQKAETLCVIKSIITSLVNAKSYQIQ